MARGSAPSGLWIPLRDQSSTFRGDLASSLCGSSRTRLRQNSRPSLAQTRRKAETPAFGQHDEGEGDDSGVCELFGGYAVSQMHKQGHRLRVNKSPARPPQCLSEIARWDNL
jgi:hypothetical protein